VTRLETKVDRVGEDVSVIKDVVRDHAGRIQRLKQR
jgi:hypothetical protein